MFILAKQTNCKFTHTIRYRVKTFYLHICVKYRNFADEIRKEDRFGCLQPLKNNAKTQRRALCCKIVHCGYTLYTTENA